MAAASLDIDDMRELAELMNGSSRFSALTVRAQSSELVLRRERPVQGLPVRRVAQARLAKDEAASIAAPPHDVVSAPSVGTVRLTRAGGSNRAVEAGDRVEPGKRLCSVEVMGRTHDVSAPRRGAIHEVLVADAELVGFGQPLFVLREA